MTQVLSFTLTTGQELIATLVCATGIGYRIKSPLAVHVLRGKDGEGTLAFAQWSMVQADVEIELFDHALLHKPVPVIDEVEASYLTNVSGVFVPPPAPSRILHG